MSLNFLKANKKNKFIKIVYCPPSTLNTVKCLLRFNNTHIEVGAQNCHENPKTYGALHRFILIRLCLKMLELNILLLGHSEIRQNR